MGKTRLFFWWFDATNKKRNHFKVNLVLKLRHFDKFTQCLLTNVCKTSIVSKHRGKEETGSKEKYIKVSLLFVKILFRVQFFFDRCTNSSPCTNSSIQFLKTISQPTRNATFRIIGVINSAPAVDNMRNLRDQPHRNYRRGDHGADHQGKTDWQDG